jgi:hypothetical protein
VLIAVLVPTLASGSSSRGHDVQTVRTIQQTAAFTSVDADHNGTASIGDYSVAQVVHLDPTTGKQIGTGVAICTQVDADGTLFDCQGSDVLPGGELREAGKFTIGKTWHLSILGGSGRYDGASGSVDGTWLDPQLSRSRDVFTIRTD